MVGYMILFSKKLKLGRRYKGPRECGNETKRGKAWPGNYAWIEEWVGQMTKKKKKGVGGTRK